MALEPSARLAGLLLTLIALPAPLLAQSIRGVVLDQTGLPLPGVTLQLLDGPTLVTTLTTEADGSFLVDAALPGDAILASLDGFEATRVGRTEAERIVLQIAHATEATTVVAPVVTPSSPTAPLIGNSLNAATVARMPSTRMKARESLPLLPSVVRGPDGLLALAGARAYDTPLTLDGFNLADPATGLSSVNLPFEAVRGVDVLRDPMAVTYGGLIGGLVKLESRSGGDRFMKGIQGFVPRPRFVNPGLGRIEGIFPRAYAGGSSAGGSIRYIAAAEYDYERIPVPGVTEGRGPDILEQSSIVFARVDAQLAPRYELSLEAFAFPTRTGASGLSPRRDLSATADLTSRDLFTGMTHRFLTGDSTVFTMQFGVLVHDATVSPNGSGPSFLSPQGWTGNWFSTVERSAARYSAVGTLERIIAREGQSHDVTISGELAARTLNGHVSEGPVVVTRADGLTVRSVEFGAATAFDAGDRPVGVALRDVWQANEQLQIDAGARLDHSRYTGTEPSARVGVRYAVDPAGVTVVKAGYGNFVGTLPLAVPAFADYPSRVDRWFDPASGNVVRETTMAPSIGQLRFPRAVASTLSVERQLAPGLDALVALTHRRSFQIAKVTVPPRSGNLTVESSGSGTYRDAQVAIRRKWPNDQLLFVSYVRSSVQGDLNEFAVVFQTMDAPLLQNAGVYRLVTDAPDRVLAWGTFNLPQSVVVSPMTEWRSGFRFSPLNTRYQYNGTPNERSFPPFFTLDMVVYKTFTVRNRSVDLGVQLFNLTNHRNPRDVHPVVDGPRYGQFTNSVGPIVRGYMMLKW